MLDLSARRPITCGTTRVQKILIVKIPATLQPLVDATLRTQVPSLIRAMKVGQLLDATVLSRPEPGLLRLQIATTELLARSALDIAPGTRLRLEVSKGQPLPELRVVYEPTARDRQQQVVRTAMARQLPAGEVRQQLPALRELATAPRGQAALRQLTDILRDAGIKTDRPIADQLRRVVERSGLFHEARLAGTLPADPADAKTRLLQLLTLLHDERGVAQRRARPAAAPPGETPAARTPAGDSLIDRLIRLVEGSLSRIQLQQSVALPGDDGQRQAWQIDLPIHLPDETHEAMLRIERDGAGDGKDGQAGWGVNLVFQFDSIGTLQCRIALSGSAVSTTFWCDRVQTHARIEQRLPVLREAFEAQGLEVVHLAGVLGEPPQPLIRVPVPDSLLDERA